MVVEAGAARQHPIAGHYIAGLEILLSLYAVVHRRKVHAELKLGR